MVLSATDVAGGVEMKPLSQKEALASLDEIR
jgi:hypothetical protein